MTLSPEPRRLLVALVVLVAGAPLRAEPATFALRVAPVLERNCTVCHGEKKQKAGLRLDSFEQLMLGSENDVVVKPGDLKGSELYRRITLPADDEHFMPSDGKPPLQPAEVALLQRWIASGASETATFDAPALAPAVVVVPLAPDYRPRLAAAAALEHTLGVRLLPRSRVPTDGLVLRTASAPARCDDAALAQLAPFADLIVEAELARTKVTDAGMAALAACQNLRRLDLTHTAVTSRGLPALASLKKLETLNLTETGVDDAGVAVLKALPSLQHVWLFGTAADAGSADSR